MYARYSRINVSFGWPGLSTMRSSFFFPLFSPFPFVLLRMLIVACCCSGIHSVNLIFQRGTRLWCCNQREGSCTTPSHHPSAPFTSFEHLALQINATMSDQQSIPSLDTNIKKRGSNANEDTIETGNQGEVVLTKKKKAKTEKKSKAVSCSVLFRVVG